MYKHTLRKFIFIFIIVIACLMINNIIYAANYPLELINIKPIGTDNISPNNRIFRAYPGFEYNIRAGVIGGLYPYTYSLANAPTGMSINEDTGEITWTNPQANATPTLTVTDSENTTVSSTWTITVTTSGFYFVDAENGRSVASGGTGTEINPWRSMRDWYRVPPDNTYKGAMIYWREGTYAIEGWCDQVGEQQGRLHLNINNPAVWLAYPRENVTFDHSIDGTGPNPANDCTGAGEYLAWQDGNNSENIYIDGITFANALNHSHRISIGWDYTTFRRNTFHTIGPGANGHNSSVIMTRSGGTSVLNDYSVWQDNNIYNMLATPPFKFYSINKNLIEDNIMNNQVPFNSGSEGLALKAYIYNTTIRGNTISNIYRRAIGGNMNQMEGIEILYNLVHNTGSSSNGGSVIEVNNFGTAGNIYLYRNTFKGSVRVESTDSSDGPFYFYNNVIVNEDSGTPSGSHIYHFQSVDASRVIENNNLAGYPADNIVDSNGNLTSSYSSYIGTHGHQLSDTPSSSTRPSPVTNLRVEQVN